MEGTTPSSPAGADRRGTLALVRDLARSGATLARVTVRLAAAEGRIVLHRLAVRAALLAGGLLVAGTGLAFALAGIALGIARWADVDPWTALLGVGIPMLAAGTALAARAVHLLGEPDLIFPATLAACEEDLGAVAGGVPDDEGRGP